MNLSNKNIVHVKDGDVEYLQFRKLLEYSDKIQHCYTMKCDNYKEDNGTNYKKLFDSLKLDYNKLVQIEHQIHSNLVENVDNENKIYTNMDGLVTNLKEVSLSLRFADCTPIYLYDPVKNVIGNIHSGWKGTAKKIALEGVKKLVDKYESNSKDIIACIGPAIGKCHFEVDEDVKNIFENTFSYLNINDKIILKGKIKEGKQKYFIDTNLINRKMLEEAGLKEENIIESNICTVCNSNLLHSYRADKEKSGRNTAIIGLKFPIRDVS